MDTFGRPGKYLFISYSHDNKDIVYSDIATLVHRGVRIWYDESMKIGEDWWIRAQKAMRDADCVGVVFYNSPEAFISAAVDQERVLGKKLKESGKLQCYGVNLGAKTSDEICDEAMSLATTPELRRTYRENVASFDLFSENVLVVREEDADSRIERIYKTADENGCVDSAEAVKKTLDEKPSAESAVLTFGAYIGDPVDYPSIGQKYGRITAGGSELIISGGKAYSLKPLKWSVLYAKDGIDVFLCEESVKFAPADASLGEFLSGEFFDTAFSASERSALVEPPRLFNSRDVDMIAERNGKKLSDVLDNERSLFVRHWWTAMRGISSNFAKTVYRGHINSIGFNVREKKGVKPVIALRHDFVSEIKG